VKDRTTLVIGSVVVAAAIVVAFTIHQARVVCSQGAGGGGVPPPCPQPTGHLVLIRAIVMIGGLVIAAFIYFGNRTLRNRRRET
jgi:hypothetical protein